MEAPKGYSSGTFTEWAIKDQTGRPVAIHVRKDLPDGTKKNFWRRPGGEWGLGGMPVGDLPLYGIEHLDEWDPDQAIAVVEGEKARDVLAYLRIPAVATVTGAGGTPSRESLSALAGRRVVLWSDNDEPGREHMDRVGAGLMGLAAEILVFEWPDAPEKGDAYDYVETYAPDAGMLERMLENAPAWKPPDAGGEEAPPAPPGPDEIHNTDLGNGIRFALMHGDRVRYCDDLGGWHVFDGRRWSKDRRRVAEGLAKETVREMYAEAAGLPEAERKALASWALRSESKGKLEAMLFAARSEEGIPLEATDFDRDGSVLNCHNGTVDLRTGARRNHAPADLITQIAPVAYDPDATAPAWEEFLERVLPSEDLRRFVQRAVGYSLLGDSTEEVLFFLYGTGANGKSTFINAIMEALGDYAKQSAPELLTVKGHTHPTELAGLKGARFVASVEVEEGKRLAESLVKQLTGRDRISARFMRQDFFEFDPTHSIFLAANHKPVVRGTDNAIWRRIKLVPFEVTIPEAERDPGLQGKLRDELPGVLAWAVRGCLDYQRHGLGEPEEVREATEEYRAEMDVLAAFLDDCCVIDPDASVGATPLYEAYREWCEANGERPEPQKSFGTRIRERGFEDGRDPWTRRKLWRGIGLFSNNSPPEDEPPSPESKRSQESKRSETENRHNSTRLGGSSVHAENRFRKVSTDPMVSTGNDQIAAFFEDPPEWAKNQARVCREKGCPERLVKPLACAVATELHGSPHRWREVLPAVEAYLARKG